MIHHHSISHLVTSIDYYIIGLVLLTCVFRVWWTHPVNRAFIFGRYVTPEGVKVILRNLPLVFLFGAFIASCALDHQLDWLAGEGYIDYSFVELSALIEALVSTLAAISVVYIAVKALWTRNQK